MKILITFLVLFFSSSLMANDVEKCADMADKAKTEYGAKFTTATAGSTVTIGAATGTTETASGTPDTDSQKKLELEKLIFLIDQSITNVQKKHTN